MLREIVILSGKGGTGKTTIASSFSLLPPKKIVVDADVDAPDLHIVLKPKILEAYVFRGNKVAIIDKNICNGCGLCREYCRFDAVNEDFTIDEHLCEGCALCYFVCPEGAITLVEKESGNWFVANSRSGIMLHARLIPGEENSGKLITLMRKRAREIAAETGVSLILIDGPPGIGCPAISSITGVTDAVIVTEPTASGVHDMKRIIELAKHFGVKMYVIINRFDINEDYCAQIEDICQSEGIELLGRIPVTDEIPTLQIEGKAPVEQNSFTGELIKEMWEKLIEEGKDGGM